MLSTKIICTIGPASDSPLILAALADAGMNVGKVNSTLKKHFQEVGATMSKEWASKAGSRGQAVLAAYK